MRLIDADALKAKLDAWARLLNNTGKTEMYVRDDAICIIDDMPTIDAVPVVRCEDCKQCDSEYQNSLKEKLDLYGLCKSTETMVYSDDYCSYGERKDNGNL